MLPLGHSKRGKRKREEMTNLKASPAERGIETFPLRSYEAEAPLHEGPELARPRSHHEQSGFEHLASVSRYKKGLRVPIDLASRTSSDIRTHTSL